MHKNIEEVIPKLSTMNQIEKTKKQVINRVIKVININLRKQRNICFVDL